MCLLVNQSQFSPALSDEWLADFYSHNEDGVGVMYSENGIIIIEKALPKDAETFIGFYRKHIEGRECSFHLRMKTHGNIDLENCHPYEVLSRKKHGVDLWMMHNGILSTGNAKDATKSDTWHYIRDYLRPMLAGNPQFYKHPSFAEIIGKHIGTSNKFVFMDHDGFRVTINESDGVYWGGLWLSNEYAWSASNSTTNAPFDDPEIALAQVSEKPAPKTIYQAATHPAYYDGEFYGSQRWDYLIDDALDELERVGYKKAGSVPYNTCLRFGDEFGASAFGELAQMVIDREIDERTFEKMLFDHKFAVEMFPWLLEEKHTYDGDWLNA